VILHAKSGERLNTMTLPLGIRAGLVVAALFMTSCGLPKQSNRMKIPPHRSQAQGQELPCEEVRPAGTLLFAYRVPFHFPERRMWGERLGVVVIGFDVDSQGSPINVRVKQASLGSRYVEVVLDAFERWRLCPQHFGEMDKSIEFRFEAECSPGRCVDG